MSFLVYLTKSSIEIDSLGYIFFVLFALFKVVDFGLIMKLIMKLIKKL